MPIGHLRAISRQEERSYLPPVFDILEKNRATFQQYLLWRQEMASWLFDTADLYEIHSATVEAAQSMLDRLSSIDSDIIEDFDLYQVSCFVCLLIACKNCESRRIFRKSKIRDLIQEFFCQEELDNMELHILYSLQWRIQPPTSIEIACRLLAAVPFEIIPDRSKITDRVTKDLRTTLVDSRFLSFRASSKALVAVLQSLHSILKPEPFQTIQNQLKHALDYKEDFGQELTQLHSMMYGESKIPLQSPGVRIYHPPSTLKPSNVIQWKVYRRRDTSELPTRDASPRSVLTEN